MKGTLGEITFDAQLTQDRVKGYQREFRFDTERMYRLDFAWPERKVGVEINGGIFLGKIGAHSSPTKILRDMEKGNLLVQLGWRVLRFTPAQVKVGEALEGIKKLLETA